MRRYNKTLLLLTAFSVSACRPETDQTREPAASQPVAPECPDSPAAPEPAAPPAMRGPTTRFTIEPPRRFLDSPQHTQVWAVIAGQCVNLRFISRTEQAGHVEVGTRTVQYQLTGDQIELFEFNKRVGPSRATWPCSTVMQLGEDGRLGQADLFADKPDCEVGQATAAPLDDSRELIMRKCFGEQLAVDTKEVDCGMIGEHVGDMTPGCISLIANDLALHTPTPPRHGVAK